jgi:DNA-binding CsgD family transcriptional regulator
MLAWQSAARGLHDDARRALEQARVLTDRAGTTGVHAHQAITAAFCALCRGDLMEVAALLEARIAAGDDAAVEAFEAALAAHGQAADAFEAARTRLLYGARLRRAGPRVAAREQLRAALEAFTAMDLTAWSQRATDELAATGATARLRRPLASEPLTSQETRVALLVARGLSNREVAAALFLSPRTVEHHLASVFRKRGIRSRTEVAAAFAAAGPAQQ